MMLGSIRVLLYIILGNALLKVNEVNEAIFCLYKAIDLDPTNI